MKIVILGQFLRFWYHSKALNETDKILATTSSWKFLKKSIIWWLCLIIRWKWLTVIFESLLWNFTARGQKIITDHFADHQMIPKHQGFWGEFHRLNEHHGWWFITFPVTTFLDLLALWMPIADIIRTKILIENLQIVLQNFQLESCR